MFLALAGPASAATINVNTTNDELNSDGDCSLREATRASNSDSAVSGCTAGSGTDTINVPAGRYVLTIANIAPSGIFSSGEEDASQTGDLDLSEATTIAGAGARSVTIDANGIDRVIETTGVIQEGGPPPAPTTIAGVTITGGETDGRGGGIEARLPLTLRNSTVDSNTSSDAGGGLQIGTQSSISRSTISNNRVIEGGEGAGGGIHNNAGSLTIDNSTISGNSATGFGGGIAEHGDFLALGNATVANNSAGLAGGGVQGVRTVSSEGNGSVSDFAANSIVANNRLSGGDGPTPSGVAGGRNCANGDAFNSGGTNLSNTDECGFDAASDQPSTPAGIRPLANNGGPTNTHALAVSSAAVDEGSTSATTDQRGVRRPQDGDSNGSRVDDSGAYELVPAVQTSNDGYSTRQNDRLDVAPPGVLGNDSGGQGGLSAAVVDGPNNGTLALRANGSFSYTPDRGFRGSDSFTYRACDAGTPRDCDEARVTVTVRGEGGGTGGEAECTITGTSDNDLLRGTPGDDVICGAGGNDVIRGLGGDDIIRGGDDNDVLRGGGGNDRLEGGDGSDDLVGENGDDTLIGGLGADDLTGQLGADTLDASDGVRGNDVANGGPGEDSCSFDPEDERTSC